MSSEMKKALRDKISIEPSKDFDNKFWAKFDEEFAPKKNVIPLWSMAAASVASLALVFTLVLPQFQRTYTDQEIQHYVDTLLEHDTLMLNSTDDQQAIGGIYEEPKKSNDEIVPMPNWAPTP